MLHEEPWRNLFENNLVQELVPDPLLVEGRIFDVGVYVAITSIEPLRVSVYDDVLLRFCPSRLTPAWEPDMFIIKDNYTPVQTVLGAYHAQWAENNTLALSAYLRDRHQRDFLADRRHKRHLRAA